MNINNVTIVGRVCADPLINTVDANGAKVANIRIAVNRHFKDSEKKDRKETLFIDVEAWRKHADLVDKFVKKGDEIGIQGRLKSDTWTPKDEPDKKRSKIK